MMANEKRRLFIGGLNPGLTEQEIEERFGRHGNIFSVQIKTKKDEKGNPVKTFAYLDIALSEKELKKCMSLYNNAKWKGNTMQIQLAKESFLTRLERERQEPGCSSEQKEEKTQKRPREQEVAEKRLAENFEKAGVTDFNVKGKVPGTQIDGEKNWVVGKYGRVLPVVYIRRKDKQKIVKCDPSKFSHHVKKLREDTMADGSAPVSKLTWDLPETTSEKRKGVFPQGRPLPMHRKRVKDDVTVRREQLIAGVTSRIGGSARRVSHSDTDSRSSSEGEGEEEIFPEEVPLSVSQGNANIDVGFEIVRDVLMKDRSDTSERKSSSSNTKPNAFSMAISPPDYDSDRDSVDTDEICTSFRTSANVSGSQGSKRKPEVDADGPSEHIEVENKRKRTRQFEKDSQIVDAIEDSDIGSENSEQDDEEVSEDDVDSEGSSEDINDSQLESRRTASGSASSSEMPSSNFKPLILDRSELLNTAKHTQEMVSEDDSVQAAQKDEQSSYSEENQYDAEEEDGDEDEIEEDNREGEDKVDEEEKVRSLANLDFEPLILDRTALAQWSQTPAAEMTSADQVDGNKEQSLMETRIDSADDAESAEDHQERDCSSDIDDSDADTDGDPDDDSSNESAQDEDDSDNGEDKDMSSEVQEGSTTEPLISGKEEETKCTIPPGKDEASDVNVNAVETSAMMATPGSAESGKDLPKRVRLSKSAKKQLAREAAEKQRLANERRMESMRKQQRALIDRQSAIKGALAAVDSKEKQGKHITFDSDEEEEDVEEDEAQEKDQGSADDDSCHDDDSSSPQGANKSSSEKNKKEQGKNGKISLFGSDDDDDDEDDESNDGDDVAKHSDNSDDDSDDERFKIRPQYEGEAGQKLLRLEERYGGDSRFRLDTRFLEEGSDAEQGEVTKTLGEPQEVSIDLQEEKQRSLAILQSMMGTPIVTATKKMEPNFKDPSQLHYDPSRDEHSKYEITPEDDDSDAKQLERELRKEKRKLEEERAEMPDVSKEKFFQVSSNLKDAFSTTAQGHDGQEGGAFFTFFGGDDSEGEEKPEEDQEQSATFDLASSLIPSKRFKYDSSDMEDEDEDEEDEAEKMEVGQAGKGESAKPVEEEDATVPQMFFFQSDDARLKDGPKLFCRPKVHGAMMSAWEELKGKLQNDFRKRHHKAVRDQKTSKKWHKKTSKTKT